MAGDQDADKKLLDFGLGSVTWWGYSPSEDLSKAVDKKGLYAVIRPYNILRLLS